MRTFQLFWQKTWDNLFHLIVVNFIWFTLSLPLMFALVLTLNAIAPPLSTQNERALSALEREGSGAERADEGPVEEGETAPGDMGGSQGQDACEADAESPDRPFFNWGPHVVWPLIFLVFSWILFCIAAGFVFYAAADMVTGYDFSGYRCVLEGFLRRGPLLKSILSITVCAVTFVATVVNVLFYLHLAAARSPWYLVLAGVMLWFLLFVMMTFALALPLAAQRGLRILPSLRLGALLALSRPLRMFIVITVAGAIVLVALVSGAGVGFFIVSVPATLFNSEVRARLEEIEESDAQRSPPQPEAE